jgi:hypothetical protein
MLGAGTVVNPIIKVVTTIAILAGISIFVIKPVIETSEKVSDSARERSEQATRDAAERTEKIQLDVSRRIALSAAQSARATGDSKRAKRIVACIREAQDADAMDFCRAL